MDRAMIRVNRDIECLIGKLQSRGILVCGEEKNDRELSRVYNYYGSRHKYIVSRGAIEGELELLMEYYLGLYDGPYGQH
jgi:hypothetical protein